MFEMRKKNFQPKCLDGNFEMYGFYDLERNCYMVGMQFPIDKKISESVVAMWARSYIAQQDGYDASEDDGHWAHELDLRALFVGFTSDKKVYSCRVVDKQVRKAQFIFKILQMEVI
jgi:hypothetical protein